MKVTYQGRQVEATEVEFFIRKEDWNEYQLSDGTLVRFKTVVSDIIKIPGEVDSEGNPVYLVRSSNLVRTRGL
jgi:hypothetical protein